MTREQIIANILRIAASPRGFSPSDQTDVKGMCSGNTIWNDLNRRVAAREMFKVKVSHKVTRYFTNEAHAETFRVEITSRPAPVSFGGSASVRFSPDAQVVIPPNVKYTVAPPPPHSLRTNTHPPSW